MSRCSGLCSNAHQHKNELLKASNIHRGRAGRFINPDTGKKEWISYDTHKRCNGCNYWVLKKGEPLSSAKSCPCCKANFRIMPRYNGTKDVSKRREQVRDIHRIHRTAEQEQGVMP